MAVQYPTPALGAALYTARERAVLSRAMRLLERGLREPGAAVDSPTVARNHLRLWLAQSEVEVFAVLYLNAQNALIEAREMSRGTLKQTSVYPREVLRAALQLNADAVILAHNHPSGIAEPSNPDRSLTQTLKSVLALVDVRVLDHVIVGGTGVYSFAEHGLI